MSSEARSPSRGSAYVLVLGCLVVLTTLGMALVRVGQSERKMGESEYFGQQALNAAESGLAVATARLLAGLGALEVGVAFGSETVGSSRRESRFELEAPEALSFRQCHACLESVDQLGKADYRLASAGEFVVLDVEGLRVKRLGRATVSATLTLQPWPVAGGEETIASDTCALDVLERAREHVEAELHPPGCRWSSLVTAVSAVDPVTGSACTVRLATCVLVGDWRLR